MRQAPLLWLAFAGCCYAQQQPFTAEAMMQVERISEPRLSPDGRLVVFTVQRIDVPGNRSTREIFLIPVSGGSARLLTLAGDHNQGARWSPDGRQMAFVSDRGGSSQIWMMDADGTNPRQVTRLSTEVNDLLYAPDGKNLVFTSDVYPECGADDACNQKKLEAGKNSKVTAHLYDHLLYRHWTKWDNGRRSHVLIIPVAGGPAKDLTPGDRDVPPFSLGGGPGYALSPDGAELCYVMNADPVPAISTNSDLFVVATAGGPARKITSNPAADDSPQYSPDGKYIAYRAQLRPGYESDRWRLLLLERATGKVTNLTDSYDRWVGSFTWPPDSQRLFFTAEDRGRQPIQFISVTGGEVRMAASGDYQLDEMQFTPDGKTMIYTQQSGTRPVEIYRATSAGGAGVPLTHINDALFSRYKTTPLEEFWADGAEGARIQSFVVKPFGFQAGRKYPVLLLIHGGPQGAWGYDWTYRWNAQVFAAAGYVVVMPNPRGSTGYGQKFIDEINGDWGGRPFDDLMGVTDHLVTEVPYVDGSRMAAGGGSYGGYMADWIQGHTARFKALVSHAGVYDLRSEFGATEELWFPLWEFGGTPWDNPDVYARWSPSNFVKDFKTPMLVIHGEQDFRVPYGQGLELFTALQLQKVPSKLLLFPDEGHWVLKPQNSLLWYKTFLDWIETWTKKPS